MAIDCASTVEICAVRATRLDSLGFPAQPPNNVYIVQDVIQLQMTRVQQDGQERRMEGGCGGCVIAQKTDDDQFTRFDLELQAGRLEPGFLEMMAGATIITDSGETIGVADGAKLACGTPPGRVAFEAWSKRWTADDEQDPVFPWWHWLFPSVRFVSGDETLQADFSPIVLTGKTRANTAWGVGPYGDQPEDITGNHRGVWATDENLPVSTCDYSDVTVAT